MIFNALFYHVVFCGLSCVISNRSLKKQFQSQTESHPIHILLSNINLSLYGRKVWFWEPGKWKLLY